MTEHDIQDGAITVTQGKTGAKLRISIEGELSALMQRIMKRKAGHKIRNFALIVDTAGQRMTLRALQGHFSGRATLQALIRNLSSFVT